MEIAYTYSSHHQPGPHNTRHPRFRPEAFALVRAIHVVRCTVCEAKASQPTLSALALVNDYPTCLSLDAVTQRWEVHCHLRFAGESVLASRGIETTLSIFASPARQSQRRASDTP
jgi:hypothetical protein